MPSTYTSPYGNTPQASAFTGLQDILGAIQGPIQQSNQIASAAPQHIMDMQQQAKDQSGVQQGAQQYDALSQMFAADHNLAQKYTAPNMQTTAPKGPNAIDLYSSDPNALGNAAGNARNEFQGFSDPFNGMQAQDAQLGGIKQVMGQLTGAIDWNKQKADDAYAKNVDAYKAYITGVQNAATASSSTISTVLNLAKEMGLFTDPNSLPLDATADEKKTYYSKLAQQDASKKMTLSQLMQRYRPYLDPKDILDLYNTVNNDPTRKSNFGPAKETADQLEKVYGITMTPQQRADMDTANKAKTGATDISSAMAMIDSAEAALKKSGSGIQNSYYENRVNNPIGMISGDTKKTNSALANVNTQLFKVAGTQFPKNEQALLGGIVLGIDKAQDVNQSALDTARQRLNNQLSTLKGIDATSLSALRASGYDESTIYQYLSAK